MQLDFLTTPPDTSQLKIINDLDKKAASTAELIKEGRFTDFFDQLLTWTIDFAGKLLIVLLLFFAGKWIIGKLRKLFGKILTRRKMDSALQSFLINIAEVLLYVLLITLIINIVGSQPVSMAAIIASAGLAIGLAVKDNLSNFAGGVMLLFNKPFKGGDYIQAQDIEGTVKAIGILYTTLITFDNKTIYIPNGPLSTGTIVNYSTQFTRRVDLTVNVDYGSDVELVKKILIDSANRHDKVMHEPVPFARMVKMSQSSIDFVLRVWVNTEDYWSVLYDLTEHVYEQLNLYGLNIPFPQMTVHLSQPDNEPAKQQKKEDEV